MEEPNDYYTGNRADRTRNGRFRPAARGSYQRGIIVGDDGVLVIDSLRVPSFARDLIRDVRHITDKPIQYLVDTHSHWDHSWGNEEFPEALSSDTKTATRDGGRRVEQAVARESGELRRPLVRRGRAGDDYASQSHVRDEHEALLRRQGAASQVLGQGAQRHSRTPAGRRYRLLRGRRAGRRGPIPGDCYPRRVARHRRPAGRAANRAIVSGHGPVGEHSALAEARDFIYDLFGALMARSKKAETHGTRHRRQSPPSLPVTESGGASIAWRETLPEVYGKLANSRRTALALDAEQLPNAGLLRQPLRGCAERIVGEGWKPALRGCLLSRE